MSQECGRCPALQSEISRLHGQVNQLARYVEHLRTLLGNLQGAVGGTVRFIEREQDEPTIPRKRLLPTILGRLQAAYDESRGKK